MIRLIDILKAQGIALGRYKVHLATPGNTSPLEAYLEGTFKDWQEEQNGKNFECDTVIGLIHRGGDRWLFAGVYRILGNEVAKSGFKYKTELLPGQEDLIGRIVVKYKRVFRHPYIWGDKYGSQLEVVKLLELPFAVQDFEGFNKVRISHKILKQIIRNESWQAALSSVKCVYLIVDRKTGKAYVGSAYGKGGIWERWCCYGDTDHGHNVKLINLLEVEGPTYAENFQYAILEIADPLDTDKQVLERETHWKEVLMSREHGYN
jgi:hypothetical protein